MLRLRDCGLTKAENHLSRLQHIFYISSSHICDVCQIGLKYFSDIRYILALLLTEYNIKYIVIR
jgi:hypothetical protein